MAEGRFREDLLYRLNTVELRLPPLRERREDVPLLAGHFLERSRAQVPAGASGSRPARAAGDARHPWPGNVRELEHAVERALLMSRTDQIEPDYLRLRPSAPAAAVASSPPLDAMNLEQAERWFIERTLARYEGNVGRAAEQLGLSRSALYRRLQKPDPGE